MGSSEVVLEASVEALTVNGPEGADLAWEAINWRTHETRVRRLRQRIFKATREEDWRQVRSLQKLMLRSWSNTLVSVRQVTQRNAGRRTARGGRRRLLDARGQGANGGAGAPVDHVLEGPAGQAGAHP